MNQAQMEKTFGGAVIFGRPRRSNRFAWFWRPREKHLWCNVCARSFPNGIYRRVDGKKKCPYADCDNTLDAGARDWSSIRRRHPHYPAVPWMSVRYPDSVTAPVPVRER